MRHFPSAHSAAKSRFILQGGVSVDGVSEAQQDGNDDLSDAVGEDE